jgi:hypothetical protein
MTPAPIPPPGMGQPGDGQSGKQRSLLSERQDDSLALCLQFTGYMKREQP